MNEIQKLEQLQDKVDYIESLCDIEYKGDLNDISEMQNFIDEYFDAAQSIEDEIRGIDYMEISGWE